MTPTPVLPSLPERFYTQESPWLEILAWHRARPGDEAYAAARAVEEALRSMLHDYARRAIESLSRAPAEPVAEIFDTFGNSQDPTKCVGHVWLKARYFPPRGTKLYAHPTESAGPAPAEMVERLKSAIEGECDGLAVDDQHAKAILDYVMGESHE